MSKARDISNLFSASTDVSTDAEVNSAIATHASNTTNRHYKAGNSASRPGSPNVGDIYTNTETGFIELYESTGWSQVGAIASAPSSVVATNQGSGRAYNNGQASVAFSAGTVAGKTYTVTSSPGSYTNTGSASPVVVTGLQSSTQYTYTVIASNNYGTSAASAASAGVTATTVPQAPTIGTATGADQSATLTFTAGATGGSSITNYKYSTDNSTYTAFSPAQTSSPLTISSLTNGQNYSFYLKAVNANGDSAASAASNSTLVGLTNDYQLIASAVVGAGGTSVITFDNIPQTYSSLEIWSLVKTEATGAADLHLRMNNDSGASNYAWFTGYGPSAGSATAPLGNYSTTYITSVNGAARGDNSVWGATIWTIPDYSKNTKFKQLNHWGGFSTNGGSGINYATGFYGTGLWKNSAAVTRLDFIQTSLTDFNQYSIISLFGLKDS